MATGTTRLSDVPLKGKSLYRERRLSGVPRWSLANWVSWDFRTGCSDKRISERLSELSERELAIFAFWFGFSRISERGVRMKQRLCARRIDGLLD